MKISNFKLGIGLPLTWTHVHAAFLDSIIEMDKIPFTYFRRDNGPLDALRNQIVIDALYEGCSHLIMLDCDMTYHPKTITTLLAHNLPIVGALCYRRYPPFDPLIYRRIPNNGYRCNQIKLNGDEGLINIDRTGTGCLMFKMDVFEKIPRPWFSFKERILDEGPIGEDYRFCDRARDAGFEIFVDPSIPADHLITMKVDKNFSAIYGRLEKIKQDLIEKRSGEEKNG